MDLLKFKEHLNTYLDHQNIEKLLSSINNEDSFSSIILDQEKISKEKILSMYPNLIPHQDVDNCFIFNKKEIPLGKSLLFEIGSFYILEPCSALVSHLLNPNESDIVLDLCSAPGGKCIHASFLMKNQGLIVANEVSSSRANILSSNIEKYGRKNVTVISSSCEELIKQFPNTFTKIILDAPCSGSGMFRKNELMKEDWTLQKVISLSKIQKELILQAYSMLVPGGEMIYSTCSYSYQEDEEVIEYLLTNSDAELINLPYIQGEYRSSLHQTIHLLPHLYKGEGHFIAKIKKPGYLKLPKFEFKKNPYLEGNMYINHLHEIYINHCNLKFKNIRILRNGLKIGTLDKNKNLIYDHAYSRYIHNNLPQLDLNIQEAKMIIQGLTLNVKKENSYVVLTYLSIPFSIGKITNNILKNHYPKGLRKNL